MPDLLGLLFNNKLTGGLIGGGGAGRSFMPEESNDLFAPPDRYNIAGLPIAPLVAGGLGAGLFALLAKKGFKRQAALQGGLLGHQLMNAPILREQAQQDAMVNKALEEGWLQPASGGAPPPLPPPTNMQQVGSFSEVSPNQLLGPPSASNTAPTSKPSFRYGGMNFEMAPQATLADLFPGMGISEKAGSLRVPAGQAAQLVYPFALRNEQKKWLQGKNLDPNTPIEYAVNSLRDQEQIDRAQKFYQGLPAAGDTETRSVMWTANGPVVTSSSESAAQIRAREQDQADKAQERRDRAKLLEGSQRIQELTIQGQGEERKFRADADIRDKEFQKARMEALKAQYGDESTETIKLRLESARLQNADDKAALEIAAGDIPGQTRDPATYNAIIARMKQRSEQIDALNGVLDSRIEDKTGKKLGSTTPPENPQDKASGEYLQQFLAADNPSAENLAKVAPPPKGSTERAAYDEALQYLQQSTAEPLAMIRENYAGRSWWQQGLDPNFEKIMKQRYGWRYEAAKKMWANQ